MTRVFTYGVFDLPHFGHLRVLKAARALGDELVIGVFTDQVASGFKRRPVMNHYERLRFLNELGWGKVISLHTLKPTERVLKGIDIVAKAEGAGWEPREIPRFKHAKSILLPYTQGISTSEIIKRIYARHL